MGAISGVVRFGKDSEAAQTGSLILNRMKKYRFDHIGEWSDRMIHLSCGIIVNTPESKLERLPRSLDDQSLVITADAIIDNRNELFQVFGLEPDRRTLISDSELILLAFQKWGTACPEHLIGDYAFAIWEPGKQKLFLARDAMGSRTLYYTYGPGYAAFCTLEKPLLGLFGKPAELNEKWIADYLAVEGIQHELQSEETVYQGIYQLPPAHRGIADIGGIRIEQYWNPLKDIKPVRFKTDEEYVEAFNAIFSEAVACRLRSEGDTGIFLSGGMDSGSIAGIAAPLLEQQGKKLHGFTSVPVPGFNEKPPKMRKYNESPEVDLLEKAFPNLEVTYSDFAEKNSMTDINELIGVFEQPYKIFQNMTWYHSFLKMAAARNCTVMLNGQTGNNTISYGNFAVQLLTLHRSGRWITMGKELHAFSKLAEVPVKKVMMNAIPVLTPYWLRAWKNRRRVRRFDRFENVVVKRSLISKWNVAERLDRVKANMLIHRFSDYREDRKTRADLLPLTHIGAVETKLSLANGITIRDPSRDKRIFEFCLAVPPQQFVKDGQERYLLRRAMANVLPDPIRLNIVTKGLQSADWIYRLAPNIASLIAEMEQALDKGELDSYVESAKIREAMAELVQESKPVNDAALRAVLVALIFARFVENFKERHGS